MQLSLTPGGFAQTSTTRCSDFDAAIANYLGGCVSADSLASIGKGRYEETPFIIGPRSNDMHLCDAGQKYSGKAIWVARTWSSAIIVFSNDNETIAVHDLYTQ